jgi:hypothetical protein
VVASNVAVTAISYCERIRGLGVVERSAARRRRGEPVLARGRAAVAILI